MRHVITHVHTTRMSKWWHVTFMLTKRKTKQKELIKVSDSISLVPMRNECYLFTLHV